MQRFTIHLSRLLGLAVLLLCGGCDLEFPEEEVRLRYDAEADTLDMLLIYQGVRAENDTGLAVGKGRDRMNRVLAGRREFMFMDWPLHFDLDEELREESGVPPEVRSAIDRVQLVRVEAFLDEYQRLCVLQHFRMTGVSKVLDDANRLLGKGALQRIESGEFSPAKLSWFDAAEETAWRAFIADEVPWVSLEEGHIVLRLPATAQGAARAVEAMARSTAEEAGEELYMLPMLAANVASLQVSEGVAEFHLGRVEGADTVFRTKMRNGPYSGALRDLLVSEGLDFTGALTLDEARALLDDAQPPVEHR